MKAFLVSVVPALATGSGVGVIVNTGDANNNSLNLINTSAQSADIEISDKNIEEIANISKLKKQQEIGKIVEVNIDNFKSSDSSLDTHHSSKIYANYVSNQVDSVTYTNQIVSQHKRLEDLLKKQIKLSKEQESYEKFKNFVADTSKFSTTQWKIEKDTTTQKCKFSKGETTLPSSTDPYDECKTNWVVITLDLNQKIKEISEAESTLTGKVSNIITTN